ncbi:hypothetical protein [Frateuria terrea]|uniref:Uncharacterized protein n=2 Tax=Frateuria terrea TaxID=529704 RepID=A0A1H6Y1D8_9GAMM|nr:hypothetical protein [Frateuria terrea]SEJ35138.1 hypothetical protein SAMN04487997_3104 [Frateuria terrea]SFP49734.1 hypothetical protein SAMN02927913_2337 [Frateuria terrea]
MRTRRRQSPGYGGGMKNKGKRRRGLILLLVALLVLLVLGALRWRHQFRSAPTDQALNPAAGAPAR